LYGFLTDFPGYRKAQSVKIAPIALHMEAEKLTMQAHPIIENGPVLACLGDALTATEIRPSRGHLYV